MATSAVGGDQTIPIAPPPSMTTTRSHGSLGEQLEYWINQASMLSDSLIESQLRRSEAEERLLPLERQLPAMQSELRVLSDARASALVENARLSEWAESVRQLNHQQENELKQLRQLTAQQEATNAALLTQLTAAQTHGTSLNSALQLQQQYQAKLSQVEQQLAEAQKEVAEFAGLKFNYQVLHAKYTALKRGTYDQEHQAYQHQMEQVFIELEAVRKDLLEREQERESLLESVVKAKESEQELRVQNQRLIHSTRMARARSFQQVANLREFHTRIKREAASLLENERRQIQAVVIEVMTHLQRVQSRNLNQTQLLQHHLNEDHQVYEQERKAQEQKFMNLLQFTATQPTNQLQQQRDSQLTRSQQVLSPSRGLSTTNSAADFDVKNWLLNQGQTNQSALPATASSTTLNPSTTKSKTNASKLLNGYVDASFSKGDENLSRSMANTTTTNVPPFATSVGQSPHVQLQQIRQAIQSNDNVAPTLSSAATSIPPQIQSRTTVPLEKVPRPLNASAQFSSTLPSHHPSPYMHGMSPSPPPSSTLVYHPQLPVLQSHIWTNSPELNQLNNMGVVASNELTDQIRAQTQSTQFTRRVHSDRMAEIEAALQAMNHHDQPFKS